MDKVKLHVHDRLDLGLLVLRAGLGLMFVFMHGLPKLAVGLAQWRGLGGAFNGLLGISFTPAFWGSAATSGASQPFELGVALLALFLTGPGKFTLLRLFVNPKHPIEVMHKRFPRPLLEARRLHHGADRRGHGRRTTGQGKLSGDPKWRRAN